VAHTQHPQQQQPHAAGTADETTAAAAAAAAGGSTGLSVTAADLRSPAELSAAADAALKHLLLYVDVDQLYQAALGLYDLPLAFMVVSHSQKDPGEYLSELSRFGAITDNHLQRHAIDMALGRYSQALNHLVAAGPAHFESALKLARERGLLRQLLALTQQQQQQQQQQEEASGSGGSSGSSGSGVAAGGGVPGSGVCLSAPQRLVAALSAYGDWLMEGRKAEDAAVAYSAAGLMEQALAAYRYDMIMEFQDKTRLVWVRTRVALAEPASLIGSCRLFQFQHVHFLAGIAVRRSTSPRTTVQYK